MFTPTLRSLGSIKLHWKVAPCRDMRFIFTKLVRDTKTKTGSGLNGIRLRVLNQRTFPKF